MRILIESYNTVIQNTSGGVQIRIKNFIEHCKKYSLDVKLYNKWHDKVADYDILHIFKANIEDYQLMKLAKNNNIPVVISSVIPLEKHKNIIMNRIVCKMLPIHTGYRFLNQMLINADAVIAQTKREAEFINRYYKVSKKRIYVIPNGVNIQFNKEYKDEFSKRTGIIGKYVLQVGRFDRNKNQLNVIKAMANSGIPVVFIGGKDSAQAEYYEQCQRLATSNMHFLGWVNHDDPLLASAYQNTHVVILPSHKEIFGNSLIEGGSAGANLIATRELPIDDWGIKDICRCINPNDIENIRENIVAAYNEPLNPNTSNIINDLFSWDSVINKHLEIYKQLCAKREA